MAPVVALHHQLVGSGYQGELVCVVELLGDVLAEGVACASGGDAPATPVVGVGPEQVTHGPLMRHLQVQRQDDKSFKSVQFVAPSRVPSVGLLQRDNHRSILNWAKT